MLRIATTEVVLQMAQTVERLGPNRSGDRRQSSPSHGAQLVASRGEGPAELVGGLLQAYPPPGLCASGHPESAPLAVFGLRFRDGKVRSYRTTRAARPPCPFG